MSFAVLKGAASSAFNGFARCESADMGLCSEYEPYMWGREKIIQMREPEGATRTLTPVERAMLQGRQTCAQPLYVFGIDACDDHAGAAREPVDYDAPRVDDHAVAVGLAAVHVIASLRRRQHVGQVFDRARANQRCPVSPAGGFGERRAHYDQVDVLHRAVKLGEPQVVADRQSDPAERGVDHFDLAARLDRALFRIVLATHIEAEQVNLVVTRCELSGVVVHEAAVAHLVLVARFERHRAPDDPDAMLVRGCREKLLNRA